MADGVEHNRNGKTFFKVMEMFYILTVMVITQLCKLAKIPKTVHPFKGANFTVYKLYINKPNFKKKKASL